MGGDRKNKKCFPWASCCCCIFRSGRGRARAAPAATGAAHRANPPKATVKSSHSQQSESDKAALLVPSVPRPQLNHPKPPCSMVQEGRRPKKRGSNLIRASSSNVMLFGNLGNVQGMRGSDFIHDVLDYLPKTARELKEEADANKKAAAENGAEVERLDAEGLKEMGNEEYKNGRYAEAVALYEKAIAKDPTRASYRSNKAAALLGLGQLLEAVGDCRAAVRIDSSYCRAHHRLAALYLRLGDADRAIHHYKLSRNLANVSDTSRAQALQTHISMSDEARKMKDWSALLKLTQGAISAGADSAPQVFAWQAEALLHLHRHEEAEAVLVRSPKFDTDTSTRFFGAASTAYVLGVRAQVDISAGRFEDAVTAVEKAAQLDSNDRDLRSLVQKALAIASARLKGNDLFKTSKFDEACMAYGEGLDHDPYNAVLLCNRAACQAKLCQWQKAVDDCDAALKLRPSYSKARLRKAACNAKLERWGAAIIDYELLLRQMPGDEEVAKALSEARVQRKKNPGKGVVKESKNGAGLVLITSTEQFRSIVMLPGLCVALFFKKSSEASVQLFWFMERTSKQFPSVKFLKVDIEQCPSLAKSDQISMVPGFKLYRNGLNVRDIAGSEFKQIEDCIKSFSS